MYLNSSNLGQTETQDSDSSNEDTVKATAELTNALTEPASDAFAIHTRSEINAERIKAGLPPLVPADTIPAPKPPKEENYTIGAIALLIIVYMLFFKS